MSFASIQSQQFGSTLVYAITGSYNEAILRNILTEILPKGKYIYQVTMVITTANTLKESFVTISDGTHVSNAWDYTITQQSNYVNMAGIWDATGSNALEVNLYQSTTTINATFSYNGTLTCLKIV